MTVLGGWYDCPPGLRFTPDRPFPWWCRGCLGFDAVDDHDHCVRCVPPMGEALRDVIHGHVLADRALAGGGVDPRDLERLYHLEAGWAALERVHDHGVRTAGGGGGMAAMSCRGCGTFVPVDDQAQQRPFLQIGMDRP